MLYLVPGEIIADKRVHKNENIPRKTKRERERGPSSKKGV